MTATMKTVVLGLGAALVAVAAAAGPYVHAQDQNTNQPPAPFRGRGDRFGGPGGPMGMLPMLGRAIALTDQQKDQIKAIADAHKTEWKALADRQRTARMALDATIAAGTIDENAIRQKSAELAAVEADAAVARAHAHAEVFQILTADQKQQLETMREQMGRRMKR
jgi:Spy/CpxP family protein refolding chaperone